MKPIIVVILMSVGIMYLLFHNTNAGKKPAVARSIHAEGDTLLVKKSFIKETGIHEMLIDQLLW